MTHGSTTGSDQATPTPAQIDGGSSEVRSPGASSVSTAHSPADERVSTASDPVEQLVGRLLSSLRCEQELRSPDDPPPAHAPVDASTKPLAGAGIWEGFFRLVPRRGGTAVLRIRALDRPCADPDPHITELLVAERLRAAVEQDPDTTLTIQPLSGRALPSPAEPYLRHDCAFAGFQISLWSSQRFRSALTAALPSAGGLAEVTLTASLPLGFENPPARKPATLILRWTDLANPTLSSENGSSPLVIRLEGSTPYLLPARSHECPPADPGPTLHLHLRVQGTRQGARILAIHSPATLTAARAPLALHCTPTNDGLQLTPSIDYRPDPRSVASSGRDLDSAAS